MKEIVKFIKEGLKITTKTKVNEKPNNYHPKTKEELQNMYIDLVTKLKLELKKHQKKTKQLTLY